MPIKALIALIAITLLGACAAAPAKTAKLEFGSGDVGFTQIAMRASETKRNERASVLEFEDLTPDQGSKLTKGIFRLRSAATLATQRGFRYFVILQKTPDDKAYLIGLLPTQDADFSDAFGEVYADVSRAGILDAQKLGPLEIR